MPGYITHGDYTIPFDEDIFAGYLQNEPDLVTNALVQSGVMVQDGLIASLIKTGGNVYTIPFYGNLADTDDNNYDGQTNITLDTMGASSQSGVVYGRAHGWFADDFAADFTVANPMAAIAARVAKYWQTKRQNRLIGIAEGVLGTTAMLNSNVITKTSIGASMLSDAAQEIWGEHKRSVGMAVMHSAVAQSFEDLQRVDYLKYTDPNGVTRDLPIYQVNGYNVIIDDGVPKARTADTSAGVYTITIGGTVANGDKITVEGVEVTLDATSGASAAAAATAVKSAIDANAAFAAVYSTSRSDAVITCTERSGKYGYGAPDASITSTAGTIAVATTTAPAGGYMQYATYLFAEGAFRYASAPVANPVGFGRDELTRGGMDYIVNRFRETIHPNGFSYTLPQDNGVNVISPTDAQLATSAQWALAYSSAQAIPFGKLLSPGYDPNAASS